MHITVLWSFMKEIEENGNSSIEIESQLYNIASSS